MEWVEGFIEGEEWAVTFNNGDSVFPVTKVKKQFRNGSEDSILSFYDISVNYVATGKLRTPTEDDGLN